MGKHINKREVVKRGKYKKNKKFNLTDEELRNYIMDRTTKAIECTYKDIDVYYAELKELYIDKREELWGWYARLHEFCVKKKFKTRKDWNLYPKEKKMYFMVIKRLEKFMKPIRTRYLGVRMIWRQKTGVENILKEFYNEDGEL